MNIVAPCLLCDGRVHDLLEHVVSAELVEFKDEHEMATYLAAIDNEDEAES